ncbi:MULTISPECIES: helix-turn-helix domain-containing protein [unclassified Streptomyces]|uniref:helix-turn-helix domain-containing protein n=1 Tax=unclassified Streptomyces TaxID=2593676 RepID=UPI00278C02DA|nr:MULTISPECIES: helix-turn-helix domain-containing protein [unclassified Streptomyces]
MTTDTEDAESTGTVASAPTLTVDELAAHAGVTVRTIRFYSTRGLLPPPVIGPRRVGHYGPEHVARLALIEELQHQGMTLAAIERYLEQLPADLSAQDLAIHRAVVASWAPDAVETLSREELEQRAGRALTDADLERLATMDVLEQQAGDAFRCDTGQLRLGVQLLDVPLSLDAILASREVLVEHSRGAAQELARLFTTEVAQRAEQDVKSLSAHMQPLVIQALLTAFQRSLKEELREAFRTTER